MKDQILHGFVEDFRQENNFGDEKEDVVFEHFVNHCLVSKQYPRDFDLGDLSTGGGNDIGFDGAAFIVNGNIIANEEEVDFLVEKNGSLDVSIILIQTKNSVKFKGDQVGTLIFGIKSFFNKKPAIPENDQISNLRKIKDKIYSKSIYFDSPPVLKIFFATRGEWKEPEPIQGRVDFEINEIRAKNIFSSILFDFYDAEKLKNIYRELKRKTIKEVHFSKHVALPEIAGVRQSFVGSISAKEYINLISDNEGGLQKSLFYDNVRDYQGSNPVNTEIENTIKSASKQAALCILNNGITIIAKKVEPVGEKMKLTDFQIVNGCQSSHVIFDNRAIFNDGTNIVIKVIETTDQDLANSVIKATNRQTEVKLEAFESLAPFHKDLEEFYRAKSKIISNPIHYERRSKQYEGSASIKKWQIVTLAGQIRAYTASQLAQPQSTHRYFGELLESNRSRMFVQGQNLEVYYLSSLLLNRIEHAFKRQKIRGFYKKFKYQILYIAFQILEKRRSNDKGYAYAVMAEEVADLKKAIQLFTDACGVIDSALRNTTLKPYDAARSKAFTEEITL
ncbi:AIPR family protein [Shewanella sp. Isolate8]|uniref:AIPR family protein n=1 Tax=Shewanella sp. Isolate8 TaxID=2908529 RepID=UPI001EFE7351|nr:AIPR family protein [Shewanella sp. Isolate8]MCG9746786.1 AIPR family protein [Shewanella sp. Isolate8]